MMWVWMLLLWVSVMNVFRCVCVCVCVYVCVWVCVDCAHVFTRALSYSVHFINNLCWSGLLAGA